MEKRYISLDIFRGLCVAMMILANNPGLWEMTFPIFKHAPWDGCTPTDLVFPSFLFCVGVSMAFSLARFESLDRSALGKIFKRGALLFLIGMFINAFPFEKGWLETYRFMAVFQRIALCYMLASVLALWLKTPKKIFCAVGILSALHVAILVIFAGPEGAFTLEGCAARHIDEAIFGTNHLYPWYFFADGTQAPFDPEGLLGVLTGACTALLGYLIGGLLRQERPVAEKLTAMYSFAAISLALSQILNIWVPINKPLWSASFVLYAGGWSMFILAFITWLTDIKGIVKPFTPFRALGMNPLSIFVLAALIQKVVWWTEWDYGAVFGANEWTSLLYALIFLAVHLLIAMVLYKKKIIIKL